MTTHPDQTSPMTVGPESFLEESAAETIGLSACPFCGGEAVRIDVPDEDDIDGGVNAGGSCIQCTRCAASSALHFDRKENLVSSWNERASRCEDCPPLGYPTDKTRCSECQAKSGEEPFPDYFELVSQLDTMTMRAKQSAAERGEAESLLAATIDDLMQANTRANVFERQYRQVSQDHAEACEALNAAGKLDRLRVLEINRLRAALQFYANPEIFKSHPHGLAFDSRDMSFHAKATLAQRESYDPTTQPFDEPFRHVDRPATEEPRS